MQRQLASLVRHGGARVVLPKAVTTTAPPSSLNTRLSQSWGSSSLSTTSTTIATTWETTINSSSSRSFFSSQNVAANSSHHRYFMTRLDVDTTTPKIVLETRDGRKFALLDSKTLPKVKPSIIKRRLDKMRTYVESEKNVRHSPWRLSLICQMIAGLPVTEALQQLDFCEKTRAPLVKEVLVRAVETADKKDALRKSQLEVADCFVSKGAPLKRIKPMARGRFGKMTPQFSHIRLVLREIDFKLRIYQQPTYKQKKKWLHLYLEAQADREEALKEKREVEKYEARQREIAMEAGATRFPIK